jgi:hypothetical protein
MCLSYVSLWNLEKATPVQKQPLVVLDEHAALDASCSSSCDVDAFGLRVSSSMQAGIFEKEGPKELEDAGKAGLVTIQGQFSIVLGTILVLAYLFLQFFPDQAEQIFFTNKWVELSLNLWTGLIFKITGIITLWCRNVKETLQIDLNSPCFDFIAWLSWVIIILVVIVFSLAGTVETVNLHSVVDKFFLLQILHGYFSSGFYHMFCIQVWHQWCALKEFFQGAGGLSYALWVDALLVQGQSWAETQQAGCSLNGDSLFFLT